MERRKLPESPDFLFQVKLWMKFKPRMKGPMGERAFGFSARCNLVGSLFDMLIYKSITADNPGAGGGRRTSGK